jgi:hypothetical protein
MPEKLVFGLGPELLEPLIDNVLDNDFPEAQVFIDRLNVILFPDFSVMCLSFPVTRAA